MSKQRVDTNQTVNVLEFIGDRDRPMQPDEVATLRPILAEQEPPEEFLNLSKRQCLYIGTASDRDEPQIAIEKVGRQGEQTVWRLVVPQQEGQETVHLLGQEATRESPSSVAEGIKQDVNFSGYRPEWADVLYIPRVIPDMRPGIRRINGRFLRPAVIFGADNRQQFKDSSWPWRCVGKIFTSDGFVGSGALVGRNLVATAGHMVPATAWLGLPWWMLFVPAYYDGVSLLGSGVQSYVSHAKGYAVSGSPTGYDWAILKLKNPLGDWLGWFGFNGYSSDWEDKPYWTIVGYPGDVAGGQRPSKQSGIAVFDDDSDSYGGRELEHKGDINNGNSGGPMFGWWKGDPRLVGVVSGWEEDYIFPFGSELGNVTAGGSGFTKLVAWGRSNW